jgi:hypothetical protein
MKKFSSKWIFWSNYSALSLLGRQNNPIFGVTDGLTAKEPLKNRQEATAARFAA